MVSETPSIPQEGGTLDFNANGIAGCHACGWRGVATSVGGVESTFCPVCSRVPDPYLGPKVARNDPCPCGSGRKWKRCHGR